LAMPMRIPAKAAGAKVSRLLAALAVLLLCTGCNQLSSWRNRQIASSHKTAASHKITPPATPVALPADVAQALALDSSFSILSYSEGQGGAEAVALSGKDTTATCEWFLAQMQQRGYASEDNPSRILEGLDFTSSQAEFKLIRIKVTLNTDDQTLVEIKASKAG
jgi:hypothetical protein